MPAARGDPKMPCSWRERRVGVPWPKLTERTRKQQTQQIPDLNSRAHHTAASGLHAVPQKCHAARERRVAVPSAQPATLWLCGEWLVAWHPPPTSNWLNTQHALAVSQAFTHAMKCVCTQPCVYVIGITSRPRNSDTTERETWAEDVCVCVAFLERRATNRGSLA